MRKEEWAILILVLVILFGNFSAALIERENNNATIELYASSSEIGRNFSAGGKHITETYYETDDNRDEFAASSSSDYPGFRLAGKNEMNEGGIKSFYYEQQYDGIPVYNSYKEVLIAKNNDHFVKQNYYSGINIDVQNRISDGKINEIISKELKTNPKSEFIKINVSELDISLDKRLVIYPMESQSNVKYKLAWIVDAPLSKDRKAFTYLIDAQTGMVLDKRDRVKNELVSGSVSGMIYPEKPDDIPVRNSFSNQFLWLSSSNNVFYSGTGNNLDRYMVTKDYINLTNASNPYLSYYVNHYLETGYDFALVLVYDGLSWKQLANYTGNGGGYNYVDLSSYVGKSVKIAFEYMTDYSIFYNGVYIDDVSIQDDYSTQFYDDAESGMGKWDSNGFTIIDYGYKLTNVTTTDQQGNYQTEGKGGDSFLDYSLEGPFVGVFNNYYADSWNYAYLNLPATYNVDWAIDDHSYKREESNVFYHVNKIHDFFTRGGSFDLYDMDYQVSAYVNESGYCNAYADGYSIHFFAPYFNESEGLSCESLSLYSGVIYHEYTHNVIDSLYRNIDLPYWGETGGMHEALADYFAGTITDNPCMTPGWNNEACLRNLINNRTYQYDMSFEPHESGLILSGALWDMRSTLGKEKADRLIIDALKLRPTSFREYLNDLLIVDGGGVIPSGDIPDWHEICSAFMNHGLTSAFCFPTVKDYPKIINLSDGEAGSAMIVWDNPFPTEHTNIHYCRPDLSRCSYQVYSNTTIGQYGNNGVYNASIPINVGGKWKFYVHTISGGYDYFSKIYEMGVSGYALNIYSPGREAYNFTTIPINITSGLFGNISYIDYSISGKKVILCRNCSSYGFTSKKTIYLANGWHNMSWISTDGISSSSKNSLMLVDSVKPIIISYSPSSGRTTGGNNFFVKYTELNVAEIKLSFNVSSLSKSLNNSICKSGKYQNCSFSVNLTAYNGAWLEYNFTIKDLAGNEISSRKTKIKVAI